MTNIEISQALFDDRQEAVNVNNLDGIFYVYLALNELQTVDGFQYDFCEFQETNLNVEDLRANPEKYFELAKIELERPSSDAQKIEALESEVSRLRALLLERI